MAEVLLKRFMDDLNWNTPLYDNQFRWTFDSQLSKRSATYFAFLAKKHGELVTKTQILYTQLQEYKETTEDKEILNLLIPALMMTGTLIRLHQCINVPRLARQYKANYRILAGLASGYGFSFPVDHEPKEDEYGFTQLIRNYTVPLNWLRQFLLRVKRLIDNIAILFKQAEVYFKFAKAYLNPFISYLSWTFYIPRLSTNLFLLWTHCFIFPFGMHKKEWNLGLGVRAFVGWVRHWFELLNDGGWLIAGLLGCYLLVGGLSYLAPYVALWWYAYDVLLASIRFLVVMAQFFKIQGACKVNSVESQDKNMMDYRDHVKKRMDFEAKRLVLSVVTTVALFIAVMFCLPVFVAHPIIPILAAVALVLITVASYTAGRWLEKQRPGSSLEGLRKHSMFRQAPTKAAAPTPVELYPEYASPVYSG